MNLRRRSGKFDTAGVHDAAMPHPIFEKLLAGGESEILELIKAKTAEAVDLDFKQKDKPSNPDFEKPDKRALGETLSAFANSAGGLLIFGIVAKKGGDGVDCAQAPAPIANIATFASQARQLVGEYLLPRHDGVRVHEIPCADASGRGYLAISVERSERRPHQSKAPSDGRYYKRAGANTYAMEHFDIEDAFRRLSSPELALSWELARGGGYTQQKQIMKELLVDLYLEVDTCPARFGYIYVNSFPFGRPESLPDMRHSRVGNEVRVDASSNVMLHIGSKYRAIRLTYNLVSQDGGPFMLGPSPVRSSMIRLECRFGADGTRPKQETIEIGGPTIANFFAMA